MSSTVQDSVSQTSSVNLTNILSGDYASGSMSISGLGNGTDFTTMINQLKKIELIPTQRMLRWKSDWLQRKSAFQIVRDALVELRDVCNTMNSMDKFLVKKGTSSQPQFATATASSSAIANSYKLEVNQVATTSVWSLGHEFSDAKTNINSSGSSTTFSYEYAGTVRTLTVPPNTSLENLKNMINNDATNPGVRASLIKSANGVTFQLKGMDQGEKNDLTILHSDGLTGFPSASDYPPHEMQYTTSFDALTDTFFTSGDPKVFTYSVNGTKHNITINANETVQDFIDKVNLATPGVISSGTTGVPPKVTLTFSGSASGDVISVPNSSTWDKLGTPTTISGDPTGWHIQHSQNAQIRVDGWPAGDWLEVDSNTVADVVEGVTFTLIGEGETTVSITTDTEAVQENVMKFIEAVNNFRTTINELTKYDANKTTYDVVDAESLYEMQKGSILTGNYGVQLLSSKLKQATAGSPLGFLPRTQVGDLFVGDLFTSLSQIGIKTNATGEGSDMYGLLELNTDPNLPMLDDVLAKNPDAVAEFFAAFNKGVSDSSNFSYSSSMQNITRPGAYEVQYDIDASGNVINATINGKEAKYYEDTGQLGLVRNPPESTESSYVTATTEGLTDFEAEVEVIQLAQNAAATMSTQATSKDAAFISSNGEFKYSLDGQEYVINATTGDSLEMLKQKINYSNTNPGVRAEVVEDGGTYSLVIKRTKEGANPADVDILTGSSTCGFEAAASPLSVSTQAGLNAEFKVTTGGNTYHITDQKTNTVSIPQLKGVTFNLKGVTDGVGGNPASATIKGQAHNDADGIYVQIDNLSPGTGYTGTVRIKQGKINEILELLNGTASKPEEGMLGSKGTLQVLMDNYDKIVAGIDDKIKRETERITRWERTQKLRFSRLEATLKQYESLQSSIESQVKQLSGNSS
ncbi:MAG: hypothetical protein DELT_00346 [Desulfovibrio sp.]